MLEFGTKAETLESLRSRIRTGRIYPSVVFTVEDWSRASGDWISQIQSCFPRQLVIVRSSSIAEDTMDSAMAGVHDSVADVPSSDAAALEKAVDAVIESYRKKKFSVKDQVLVQPMLTDVSMSGVLFTRDINTGAPYYVINYDDTSGKTDTVTSGKGDFSRTLVIYRDYQPEELRSSRFQKLLEAVREIESHVDPATALDIEFAVTKSEEEIFIFQVRPITVAKRWNTSLPERVRRAIGGLEAFLSHSLSRKDGILGHKGIFGEMADWNPAEIIGPAPQRLAASLYRELVTDSAWAEARAQLGYRDLSGTPLMVMLCGKPYIDIRNSFNSFLPKSLPETIGEKIVSHWIRKLEALPELHDKIEFEIASTSYPFDFEARVATELRGVGFRDDEIEIYRKSLFELTREILSKDRATLGAGLAEIDILAERREKTLAMPNRSPSDYLEKALRLLEDCRIYGTVPFAILARCAFIAEDLLRSLLRLGALSPASVHLIKSTAHTVTSEFLVEVAAYQRGEMSEADFFRRYGHLRPGTYDILAPRYDQQRNLFSSRSSVKASSGKKVLSLSDIPATERKEVEKFLKSSGFFDEVDDLWDFIHRSIAAREYSKFEFTKNLSEALELIAAWGAEHGLERGQLAHVPVQEFFNLLVSSQLNEASEWLVEIAEKNCQQHAVAQAVRLPFLIRETADFYVVPLLKSKPNFITHLRVQCESVYLCPANPAPENLNGKIVLIEGADPGYDWIFAHGIAGLITQFGGANSHMAIRCAELDIPAAIGCGEQLFERFLTAETLCLDCGVGLITVVV